jgi:YebC/PmpR family DNA-binding regulatory protein
MAGHSHAKNVMHRKSAVDQKKAKVFTKIAKIISTAVRAGNNDANPDTNLKLKQALKMAQNANVPKDIINRALAPKSHEKFEEIMYEGYGPHGIGIIVEIVTDNKNKTAAQIREIFSKNKINIAAPNAVAFSFKQLAFIQINLEEGKEDEFFQDCLELNALDIEDDCAYFSSERFHVAQTELEKKWEIQMAELIYKCDNLIEVDEESKENFLKIIEKIEEYEYTENCWHNLKT